jgi:hypothetical protein
MAREHRPDPNVVLVVLLTLVAGIVLLLVLVGLARSSAPEGDDKTDLTCQRYGDC